MDTRNLPVGRAEGLFFAREVPKENKACRANVSKDGKQAPFLFGAYIFAVTKHHILVS